MRNRFALRVTGWVLAACAASFVSGCGGGGAAETTDSSAPSVPSTPSAPSQYSAAQRSASTDDIAAKYEELVASNNPDRWEALKTYVLSKPEFVDAGYEDDALWAKFSDGRYFLYVDNWEVPPDVPSASTAATLSRTSGATLLAAVTSSQKEVPAGRTAMFLKLSGDEFYYGDQTIERGKNALKSKGWQVSSDHVLTVDALKYNVAHGVLYMNSHSGAFQTDNGKIFAFFTMTPSTDAFEEQYAEDIADNSLIYTRSRFRWNIGLDDHAPHYAVTPKFVRKYMSFSPDSLVVLMMCNGGSDAAADFRMALTDKGAGTIVAWNGKANPYGYPTVELLFDRLTATNVIDPQAPPNRAFNFEDVWSYLSKTGKLINPGYKGPPSTIKRFGSGFDLSNPIITGLQLGMVDKMYIHGDFGTEPGTVTIGGIAYPATWADDGSVIMVPLTAQASGDVVVTVRNRRSNVRTLTSWRGQVTYEYENLPNGAGVGTLSNKVVVNLHLRGDAHAIRQEVDGTLFNNTWNIIPASDTSVSWSAQGTRSFDDPFETWSGSGTLNLVWPFTGQPNEIGLVARIDAAEKRLKLAPMFPQHPMVSVTKYDGNPSFTRPLLFDLENYGFYNGSSAGFLDHKPMWYGTYIPVNDQFNIPAGAHVANISGDERMTVRWTGMVADPPYDPNVGR